VPLYEYECPKDGVFELMQKFSDPPLSACPKCGSPVEKLLSAPAIQFKGTGWYVTDYARKGRSEGDSSKSDKKESKESGSSKSKEGGSSSTPTTGGGSSSDKKSRISPAQPGGS
jgi:putative FmdB family regulatory protein